MQKFNTDLGWLSDRYQSLFSQFSPRYDHLLEELIASVVAAIANSDTPYHTLDHTLQVVKVGQAILEGKQYYEGVISPQDWLQVMVSLFCHDVGYVKGLFAQDNCDRQHYFDGIDSRIELSPTATGAALTNCHVDRSKAYVATYLKHPQLDGKIIQQNIEMTRFPVPNGGMYQQTLSSGGLCRAADLLGQLSDPHYLQKLPALFQEFEETGMNQTLGYSTPMDLRRGYPAFFWRVIYPYIRSSLRYLSATGDGRKAIAQLYTNLCLAEMDQPPDDATNSHLQQLRDESALLSWQEAGFTFI